jgi:hypothetical protein
MTRCEPEQQAQPGEPARLVQQHGRERQAQQQQAPVQPEPQQRAPEPAQVRRESERASAQQQPVLPEPAQVRRPVPERVPQLRCWWFRRECGACRVSRPPPACYGPG